MKEGWLYEILKDGEWHTIITINPHSDKDFKVYDNGKIKEKK